MIDEKKIKEAERNIPIYLQEKLITKSEKNKEFVNFYLEELVFTQRFIQGNLYK